MDVVQCSFFRKLYRLNGFICVHICQSHLSLSYVYMLVVCVCSYLCVCLYCVGELLVECVCYMCGGLFSLLELLCCCSGPLVDWCPTSTGAVHKSVTCSCVFMFVQLNKCVVVCVVLFYKGGIVVMGV